ncbi:MAG: TIM barrel protein [Ardenticatenales bacterium]|nr:TIM barrel protein [Ardenticatenales bacterium]
MAAVGAGASPPAATFGPLALSSMWAQRFDDPDDLRPFFDAGRAMGFERFELSHTHSPAALASIPPDVVIASIHHPCPAGPPLRPGDDATSPDPAARARWTDALRRTIDTAQRLGASAICAHLGSAHDEAVRKLWFELHSRYQAGQKGSPRYVEALGALRDRLAVVQPAAIERAVAVLTRVVGDLRGAGVALGIETGYHGWELPTAGGMGVLLADIDAAMPGAVVGGADCDGARLTGTADTVPVVGAWLDTGHVGVQANVGTATFNEWFDAVARVGGRWGGMHWHDVVGVRDHLPPGMGRLDLTSIGRSLAAGGRHAMAWTLEVDWYMSPDEVVRGAQTVSG